MGVDARDIDNENDAVTIAADPHDGTRRSDRDALRLRGHVNELTRVRRRGLHPAPPMVFCVAAQTSTARLTIDGRRPQLLASNRLSAAIGSELLIPLPQQIKSGVTP